jgi:putative PIN family toxin of toxin-antitoxin system
VTIRVVIDANVFVSAAIQRGASYRIVHRWLAGEAFDLIVSNGVLAEVEDVLTRPRLTKRIAVDEALAYVRAIRILADVVEDAVVIESLTRDPDDDYLVALAREHDADVIVSGDKDLLEWEEQHPPVVTPVTFEQMLTPERPA